MNIEFKPSMLRGSVLIPPSKSLMHRYIIAAALAKGTSRIDNIIYSEDILATINAMEALGATVEKQKDAVIVTGIKEIQKAAILDCNESGSTLRFLVPLAAALGTEAAFLGKGKLPKRPITPYLKEMTKKGVIFDYHNTMPFTISGKMQSGDYIIPGNISSQFITGLLFALPFLNGDSVIKIEGKFESKPYVDMTVDILSQYGIFIGSHDQKYVIKGKQEYRPRSAFVEGDYSQAAFFAAAAAIKGNLCLQGLNLNTFQGDKEMIAIIEKCGALVKKTDRYIQVADSDLNAFHADVSDIPDLVPILAVLACFCQGKSVIYNAQRLKIKESDRLKAISKCLNKLGGQVEAYNDKLEIVGVGELKGGVTVDSFNDHRIAMSMAVAGLNCVNPLILTNGESVEKSYPHFYEDYQGLGGICRVISMES